MNGDRKSGDIAVPPCRVLLVAPSPPPYGGMALQAQMLAKLVASDGHDVSFQSANPSLPEWSRWAGRLPGVRTVLRCVLIWIGLWRQVRQVEVVHILAASWLYFFAVVLPAVVMGRLRGVRVVLNYRGGEARPFFARWGWAVRPVLRLADTITVPSEFLAAVIREQFSVPVLIVPNILNSSEFRYRSRTTLQPKMLVTRHLEKPYDVESVLKAFGAVQDRYPQASLWIAGTGSQLRYLQGLVSAWNLNNVRFLGQVAHDELPRIYDECDILLNGSRVDNFPGALLEGSAAGLAVVSTSAGGISVMYEHEKTALLVEPGDWQGLAAAVTKLLQSPMLAFNLTQRAAALARACEWSEVRKLLYRAYGLPTIEETGEFALDLRVATRTE